MEVTFDLSNDLIAYIEKERKKGQEPSQSAALSRIICDYICAKHRFWDHGDFVLDSKDPTPSTLFFCSKPYYDKYWPGGKSIVINCYSLRNIMLVKSGSYYLRWPVGDDFVPQEDISKWPYFVLFHKMGAPEVIYAPPQEF